MPKGELDRDLGQLFFGEVIHHYPSSAPASCRLSPLDTHLKRRINKQVKCIHSVCKMNRDPPSYIHCRILSHQIWTLKSDQMLFARWKKAAAAGGNWALVGFLNCVVR
ncbi:hypothetical protein NL676_031133 [Syzygium grande]|nr:hypothetical protein NL676_031133 [Syzygium grande]